jgi:dynein heavy chain
MSEADLLEVLSNSSQPTKVLLQVDKILLATKELALNTPSGNNRPSAISFIAGVGKETVKFDAPVKLDGKAENYLLSLLQSQIYALSQCLKMSFGRYPEESRVKWMMKKDENNESVDPAQVIFSSFPNPSFPCFSTSFSTPLSPFKLIQFFEIFSLEFRQIVLSRSHCWWRRSTS